MVSRHTYHVSRITTHVSRIKTQETSIKTQETRAKKRNKTLLNRMSHFAGVSLVILDNAN